MKREEKVKQMTACSNVIYLYLFDFTNIYALAVRLYISLLVSGPVLQIFFCMWPLKKSLVIPGIIGELALVFKCKTATALNTVNFHLSFSQVTHVSLTSAPLTTFLYIHIRGTQFALVCPESALDIKTLQCVISHLTHICTHHVILETLCL